MRIWSLHPSHLDRQGLIACWRETLLAQKVLRGQTRGYRSHPQLVRFRELDAPVAAIGAYLSGLAAEADARGYTFNRGLIVDDAWDGTIEVAEGQIAFEWDHLLAKLTIRSPEHAEACAERARDGDVPALHPLMVAVPGPRAEWERG
ncbi:pyrimidine dimer DNA glycosylase [Brevibacterium pityocampae]